MLIEFRVRNFRSLRDEQVLSLVASKDKTLLGSNTMSSKIKAAPLLVRSAVIYGANAAGKSNLIDAIHYMRAVVKESAAKLPGQTYNVEPFRLDTEFETQPTSFEITFIDDGIRYQYGFELTTERITNEYLLVYSSFKPQKWFDRYLDKETGEENYEFSSSFTGPKKTWQKATLPNCLFLSRAVQLNSTQLLPIYDWFLNKLVIMNSFEQVNTQFTVGQLSDQKKKNDIVNFLAAADTSIADIEITSKKVMGQKVHLDVSAGTTKISEEETEITELKFHHKTDKGKAVFGIENESEGTKRLFFLAGPILDILNNGRVLVVDELNASLHPLLVRKLVELFQSPEINTTGAQLIFSTHNTSLLDPDLFRRDQVWFVEKDIDLASKVYPLTEFSPRKDEALERGYLIGRYGALPFFNEWRMD